MPPDHDQKFANLPTCYVNNVTVFAHNMNNIRLPLFFSGYGYGYDTHGKLIRSLLCSIFSVLIYASPVRLPTKSLFGIEEME